MLTIQVSTTLSPLSFSSLITAVLVSSGIQVVQEPMYWCSFCYFLCVSVLTVAPVGMRWGVEEVLPCKLKQSPLPPWALMKALFPSEKQFPTHVAPKPRDLFSFPVTFTYWSFACDLIKLKGMSSYFTNFQNPGTFLRPLCLLYIVNSHSS